MECCCSAAIFRPSRWLSSSISFLLLHGRISWYQFAQNKSRALVLLLLSLHLSTNVPQTHLLLKGGDNLLPQRPEIIVARVRLLLLHSLRPVLFHLVSQSRDLALQVTDYVAILRDVQVTDVQDVPLDLVGNLVGAICVDQGVLAFVPMHAHRRHVRDHNGSAIAAESVLQ